MLARGEFNIQGFRNKDLRKHLSHLSPGQVSRLLKGLRLHGLIRKCGQSYKYYLSANGKKIVGAAVQIKNVLLPEQLSLSAAA